MLESDIEEDDRPSWRRRLVLLGATEDRAWRLIEVDDRLPASSTSRILVPDQNAVLRPAALQVSEGDVVHPPDSRGILGEVDERSDALGELVVGDDRPVCPSLARPWEARGQGLALLAGEAGGVEVGLEALDEDEHRGHPSAVTVGLITSSDGFRYQLTEEDLDTLAKELAHEGGSDAATCWTMAQRFYLLHGRFDSLTQMVMSFSQPLNPRWLATGEFCRPGGRYAGDPMCSADATARRAVYQSSPPPLTKRAYVEAWARGLVANPVPRAVDFRACDDAARELVSSGRARLVLSEGNCYVARDGSEDWPENMVLVAGRGTEPSVLVGVGIGLGIAATAALVTWLVAEEVS